MLTLERLDSELRAAPVEVLRSALRAAGAYALRPPVCQHLSAGATAVVVAGQDGEFIGCARCVFRRFPDAARSAICRACGAADEVMQVGASAEVAVRAGEEGTGRTLWVERVVALAPLCGRCRTPLPPAAHHGQRGNGNPIARRESALNRDLL